MGEFFFFVPTPTRGKQNFIPMPLVERGKEQRDTADMNKVKQSASVASQKQEISQPQMTEQAEVIDNPDAYDQQNPGPRAEQWSNGNATVASFSEGSEPEIDAYSPKRMDIASHGGHSISPSITDAWVEKVCQVKKFYIPELTNLMQIALQVATQEADVFFDEMKGLQKQDKDINYLFSRVYEELMDDDFIKVWNERLDKNDRQRIDREIEQNFKRITKKPREYKDWVARDPETLLTEKEFNDVLTIFLRRYQALKEMGAKLRLFLEESREKATNQYSDQG